jgi:hypothetical protein
MCVFMCVSVKYKSVLSYAEWNMSMELWWNDTDKENPN